MQTWLAKSEAEAFSIEDLARAPKRTTHWEGVRNYQARNFLRAMQRGDRVLYYHSNADPSAAVGIAEVVRESYPDPTAWDATSDYYDPRASPENPVWSMVDLRLVEIFPRPVPLSELRTVRALDGMELLRRGSRLSVIPVLHKHFELIAALGNSKSSFHPMPAKKKSKVTASRSVLSKKKKSRIRTGQTLTADSQKIGRRN